MILRLGIYVALFEECLQRLRAACLVEIKSSMERTTESDFFVE